MECARPIVDFVDGSRTRGPVLAARARDARARARSSVRFLRPKATCAPPRSSRTPLSWLAQPAPSCSSKSRMARFSRWRVACMSWPYAGKRPRACGAVLGSATADHPRNAGSSRGLRQPFAGCRCTFGCRCTSMSGCSDTFDAGLERWAVDPIDGSKRVRSIVLRRRGLRPRATRHRLHHPLLRGPSRTEDVRAAARARRPQPGLPDEYGLHDGLPRRGGRVRERQVRKPFRSQRWRRRRRY